MNRRDFLAASAALACTEELPALPVDCDCCDLPDDFTDSETACEFAVESGTWLINADVCFTDVTLELLQ